MSYPREPPDFSGPKWDRLLSELPRPAPAAAIVAWAHARDPETIFTTPISAAEILYGIAAMSDGRSRTALARAAETMLGTVLAGRILPFDRPATVEYARWAADRRRAGSQVGMADLQIAAIARACGATAIATHNPKDFASCGIPLIDPWAAP